MPGTSLRELILSLFPQSYAISRPKKRQRNVEEEHDFWRKTGNLDLRPTSPTYYMT